LAKLSGESKTPCAKRVWTNNIQDKPALIVFLLSEFIWTTSPKSGIDSRLQPLLVKGVF
jgi:hypothetical protein